MIQFLIHLDIPDYCEEGNHHVKAWSRHTLKHGPAPKVDSDMSLLDPVEAVLLGSSLASSRQRQELETNLDNNTEQYYQTGYSSQGVHG